LGGFFGGKSDEQVNALITKGRSEYQTLHENEYPVVGKNDALLLESEFYEGGKYPHYNAARYKTLEEYGEAYETEFLKYVKANSDRFVKMAPPAKPRKRQQEAIKKANEAASEKVGDLSKKDLNETQKMVVRIAEEQGEDPKTLLAMMDIESSGDPNAVSPTGAKGLFQFTKGVGAEFGLNKYDKKTGRLWDDNRADPEANTRAAIKLLKRNRKQLESKGIEATPANLYLAHQQGAGGASKIIRSAETGEQLDATTRKNLALNYGDSSGRDYVATNERKFNQRLRKVDRIKNKESYANLDEGGNNNIKVSTAIPVEKTSPIKKETIDGSDKTMVTQMSKQQQVASNQSQRNQGSPKKPLKGAASNPIAINDAELQFLNLGIS